MSEIRKAILKQMNKSGMTIYQVAKLVEGKVPQRTVYAFLRSEEDSLTKTASYNGGVGINCYYKTHC